MYKQNDLLYSFLLICIVRYAGASTGRTLPPPSFIAYKCSGDNIQDMTISSEHAKHIKVLTKNGGYCKPSSKDKDGIMGCITTFKANGQSSDKIKTVTIVYEDETADEIVGGINSNYYTLSCVEKVGNVTVIMKPLTVGTGIPTSPTVVHADMTQIPILTVVDPSTPKYVGDQIKLQMTVNSGYILSPQSCTAYHPEPSGLFHGFWDKCQTTDTAIIPSNKWTKVSVQSTVQIDMYAFRFVDTEELIIKCQTTICPKDDLTSCDMTCINRRKRWIGNNKQPKTNSTSATVSLALKVFDRQFHENSSQVLSPIWYIYTIGFGMIYWITLNM